MNKTVSVIVTTFNSEKTIGKTLSSILHQEGIGKEFDLELIVVDDCSTDGTIEIVKHTNAIIYIADKNSGGPNKGRNIGLNKANGDYICIADHDDEWKPYRLITQLPLLERVPIVTSGYTIIDDHQNKKINKIKPKFPDVIYYESNKTFLSNLKKSLKGQNVYLGGIIYRNELKDIHFEENFGMVDFDWILRLFRDRDSIEVNQALYNRHVDGKNLSLNEEYRKRDFYYSLLHIEEYIVDWPREVRIAHRKLHGSRARYYYLVGKMKLARFYFLRSSINLKNIGYYLTTFWGSKFVKRKFNIFG